MLSGKILVCVVLIAAWREGRAASLPVLPAVPARYGIGILTDDDDTIQLQPVELTWTRVREGVPPPLCAGRCASPPAGPVCAFDATGTARTFATLCELEAVSCRESTYYAITSLGEC